MTADTYSPNTMIKTLHGFVRVSSSNDFNYFSEDYRLSVGLLGATFGCVILAMFFFLIHLMYCRKVKPLKITRHRYRIMSVVGLLATCVVTVLASTEGWVVAIKGTDGAQDGFAQLQTKAQELENGGELTFVAGGELMTEVSLQEADCPVLTEYGAQFNSTYMVNATEFMSDTSTLPGDVDDLQKLAAKVSGWVKVSLAVPLALIGLTCVLGVGSVVLNSWKFSRISQITALVCIFVCALLISFEAAFSIFGSDLCMSPSKNTLSLLEEFASEEIYDIAV
jgi:hypothetical protein